MVESVNRNIFVCHTGSTLNITLFGTHNKVICLFRFHLFTVTIYFYFSLAHTLIQLTDILYCICNAALFHRMQMIPSGKSVLVNSLFQFFAARAAEVAITSFKTYCNLSTIHKARRYSVSGGNSFFFANLKKKSNIIMFFPVLYLHELSIEPISLERLKSLKKINAKYFQFKITDGNLLHPCDNNIFLYNLFVLKAKII